MKKQDVLVITDDFEMSHRRAPKGRGHWIFTADRKGEHWIHAGVGTYAEMRREAIAKAAQANIDTIWAAP